MRVVFLGTGTSTGVPVVGCECPTCLSKDVRDKRMRCSLYLEVEGFHVLVDTGPDLRMQSLRFGLRKVDAVLYTHAHMDHVVGFDDLRVFCWHRDTRIPLYASRETLGTLQKMFSWAFQADNTYAGYVKPEARELPHSMKLASLEVQPVPVEHGKVDTLGYRFNFPNGKSMVYMSDVKRVPESSYDLVRGVDVLAVDALRHRPHDTHFSLDEALDFVAQVKPKTTWLTHIGHELSHKSLQRELPKGVNVAYDGLSLNDKLEPCSEFTV